VSAKTFSRDHDPSLRVAIISSSEKMSGHSAQMMSHNGGFVIDQSFLGLGYNIADGLGLLSLE
jgi:hypothetical protein